MPNSLRAALVTVPLFALGACAAAPKLETSFAGAMPAGRTYALIDGTGHFGSADLPFALIEPCLAAAGLTPAVPADTLVQLAHAVRPANARLIRPEDADAKPRRVPAAREREELVLALSDPASGTLLMRASAARTLARGESAGSADALADAVCGLIVPPGHSSAAVSR